MPLFEIDQEGASRQVSITATINFHLFARLRDPCYETKNMPEWLCRRIAAPALCLVAALLLPMAQSATSAAPGQPDAKAADDSAGCSCRRAAGDFQHIYRHAACAVECRTHGNRVAQDAGCTEQKMACMAP